MLQLLRAARARTRKLKNEIAWSLRKRRVARLIGPVDPGGGALSGATLFFVPYAGVTPMFAQACVVARSLAERGHRVVFARCYRLFERCPVIDMHLLPFDTDEKTKLESCLHCADNSLAMLAQYRLEAIDLRNFVTAEMRTRIEEALLGAPTDLLQFQFDVRPFGRLSVMDLVLARKISDLSDISPIDRLGWMQYLRACLLGYLIVDRLCGESGVGRIVHANDYSLLLGARAAAGKNGVPCYGLSFPGHRNVDLRRYMMLSNVWKPFSFKLLASWPACRELSLEPERVREIAGDLLVRFSGRGSHIYSPGKSSQSGDVREALGLSRERRLIVAYTSSLDELIASRVQMEALGITIPDRPQPFASQIEWLEALTEFVEQSDDLQLVVRVHPREGPNKRESALSQHLLKLRKAFGGPYEHCRFVWPGDPVSSYDLGEAAELVLISWSTIGLEMARLAVPVLVAFSGGDAAVPCDDFHEWVPTADAYFRKLVELLDRPIRLAQVARAFRWYSLLTLGTSVDLGDIVPRSDFAGLPEYRTPKESLAIEQILIAGKDVCDLNIERLEGSQRPDSHDRESDELKRQLRRLVHFLMTGDDAESDASLSVRVKKTGPGAGGRATSISAGDRLIELDGYAVGYADRDGVVSRYSPMVARLALLCGRPVAEPAAVGTPS